MKCEEVKINLPEFIDGKLDEKITQLVKKHLESCEACNEVYTELNSFLKFTGSLPEIEPPIGMKEEFMQLTEKEMGHSHRKVILVPDWLKVAAMIIVVFGTFAVGYFTGSKNQGNEQMASELNQLKQEVLLAGLRDYSGPQKIEAVYNIKNSGQTSDQLINALVYTMNTDKNVNVRLAAINALSGWIADNEIVKQEMIHSLTVQENPLLQISLIQVLTESGVKEAKEEIQTLSDNENTDQNVREFAKDMIKTII
ncbi:MAG: zf-HC2 domain-containing protein [Prolixibacteraceae bacterium]|nr:zf-HC2 domain-containing protein [Prolixibacteraceae bacterium]